MDDYQAYRQMTFEADTPVGRVKVRVGQRSGRLDRLLNFRDENDWAFLTAWNPGGTFAGEDENRERQEALETQLEDEGYAFFSGECVPDNADWAPEQCVLVLGISSDEAIDFAEQWDQSSVVCGGYAEEARLLDASTGEDVTSYGESESPPEETADEEVSDLLDDLGGTVDESVEQYRREGPASVEEAVDWDIVMQSMQNGGPPPDDEDGDDKPEG